MAYVVGDKVEPADIANRFWAYLSGSVSASNYTRTSYTISPVQRGTLGSGHSHSPSGGTTFYPPGNTTAPSRAFYGNDLGATGDIIDASDIYDQCRIEANRFSALRDVEWVVEENYRNDHVGSRIRHEHFRQTRRRYGVVSTRGTAYFNEDNTERTDTGEVIDIGGTGVNNSLERMFNEIRDRYVAGRDDSHTVTDSQNTCHSSCHSSCHGSRGRR